VLFTAQPPVFRLISKNIKLKGPETIGLSVTSSWCETRAAIFRRGQKLGGFEKKSSCFFRQVKPQYWK